MSLDYTHLSLSTVLLVFENLKIEYELLGPHSFLFHQGRDMYYMCCEHLPLIIIERHINPDMYLPMEYGSEDLLGAINTVNCGFHLVKAAIVDEDVLAFRLCIRENNYKVFLNSFYSYIREIDDAVESFKNTCVIIKQQAISNPLDEFINRLLGKEGYDIIKNNSIVS